MAPQLVIADAAFKVYPGGVIVLRCSDWLGPARGTLSTEADATSACGTVVRDTQLVADSVYDTWTGVSDAAFLSADDTLVVDLSELPFEDGFRYMLLLSFKIEGDWDGDNGQTSRGGSQDFFGGGCDLRFYGDQFQAPSDTASDPLNYKFRLSPNYRIGAFGGSFAIGPVDGTEVLHFRAYSQDGCTTEWLLDQLYLVPAMTVTGEWNEDDIEVIQGQHGTFSGKYVLDPDDESLPDFPRWVDGADGGDANGKFTWHPIIFAVPTGVSGGDGGGDYQQVADSADAEYFVRIDAEEDSYYIANSVTDVEASVHLYGVHGPVVPATADWVIDDFARAVGSGTLGNFGDPANTGTHNRWGKGPSGFYWRGLQEGSSFDVTAAPYGGHRHGRSVWVDGSRGALKSVWVGTELATAAVRCDHTFAGDGTGADDAGAGVWADDMYWSGEVEFVEEEAPTATPPASSADDRGTLRINFGIPTAGPPLTAQPNAPMLEIDLEKQQWRLSLNVPPYLAFRVGDTRTGFSGNISIPWLTVGVPFGFRMEVRRYLIRARVWELSAGEPSTWDYEDFRPLTTSASTTAKVYPYPATISGDDDLSFAITEFDNFRPSVYWTPREHQYAGIISVMFDEFRIGIDAGGAPGSAFANIEMPDGTEIGQIELPDCQHFVHWGTRDWTELAFGAPFVEFSQKLWNEVGAAEMQRSEAVWWWLRSVHGGIVSMNWRRAQRKATSHRILTGR